MRRTSLTISYRLVKWYRTGLVQSLDWAIIAGHSMSCCDKCIRSAYTSI